MKGTHSIVGNKSKDFALKIVKCYKFLAVEQKEYVLSKQVLRSGTSIGAMCMEGEHAQSKADFLNKISIALKEANETDYWLELLQQSGYLPEEAYQTLDKDLQEIISMLVAIVKTTKKNILSEKSK